MRRRSVSVDVSSLPSTSDGDPKKKAAKKRVLKAASKSTKETKLLEAAFKGNIKDIISLVKKKSVSVHCKDEGTLEMPLHLACLGDQPEAVTELLDLGANPNLMSDNGSMPAHICCSFGHVASLQALLAPPDFSKETNRSFASKKLELTQGDSTGATPMAAALHNGHMECVQALLKYDPKLARHVDSNSETPLHIACTLDLWKAIPLLVDAECDVNARNHYESTPLHVAAKCGNIACVVALLANGSDHTLKNKRNLTPLQVAQQAQHMDVVGVLKSKEEVEHEKSPQVPLRRQTSAISATAARQLPPAASCSMTSITSALPPPPSSSLSPDVDGEALAASLPSLPAPPSSPMIPHVNNIGSLPNTLPPPPDASLAPADGTDGAGGRGRMRGRGMGRGRGRGRGMGRGAGGSTPNLVLSQEPVPRGGGALSAREYRSKKSPRGEAPPQARPPLQFSSTPSPAPPRPDRAPAPVLAPAQSRGAGGSHPTSRRVERVKSVPMMIDQKLLQAAAIPPPLTRPHTIAPMPTAPPS